MAESNKEGKDEPRVKVSDRRLFDASGERRRDSEAEDEVRVADDAVPASAPAGATEDPGLAEGVRYPAGFRALLAPFYLEALIHLGVEPHPETGNREVDLDAARVPIELLGLLEEKTRGHLDAVEEGELKDVLTQLRLLYVQRSSGGGDG